MCVLHLLCYLMLYEHESAYQCMCETLRTKCLKCFIFVNKFDYNMKQLLCDIPMQA